MSADDFEAPLNSFKAIDFFLLTSSEIISRSLLAMDKVSLGYVLLCTRLGMSF